MKRGKWVGACLAFLLLLLCLPSGCGKEETYQPELGVDGYVYPARKILDENRVVGDVKAVGDFFYYARNGEKGVEVIRIPISAIEDGEEPLPAEVIYTARSMRTAIPDYIEEQLPAELFAEESDGGQSMWVDTGNGELMDISHLYCFFAFRDFGIDADGNLYCWEEVQIGRNFGLKSVGGTLSKWNSQGEMEYKAYFPDMLGFEPCAEGKACVLGEGRIVLVDGVGAQAGEVSTEQYRGSGRPLFEQLLQDAEGHIYYLLNNYSMVQRGFEVTLGDGVQLREMGGSFSDAVVGDRACASLERKIFAAGYSDFLYEYNVEDGSKGTVLNWGESGFLAVDVRSFARITPEKLVVYYDQFGSDSGLFLLTRTPVEELPQKETIIMFSYDPTDVLKDAVMRFNRENDAYQIIIDGYGAEYSWWTRDGEAPLVDLAVTTRTPPDLLDMTFLDPHKYAEKGVLEDLAPYLEQSALLDRGDYLENALEGLTLGGCLTCIPNSFQMQWLLGKESQVGDLERWGMEEVYELLERYPESADRLVCGMWGNIEKRDYLLNTFFSYYCLEEFVDLEKRESQFESEEFARLLKLVKDKNGTERRLDISSLPCITEDALLFNMNWDGFGDMARAEACWGAQTVLRGFPSGDGEGVYPVFIRDALAIAANSTHKEAAWEFIEYFLSSSKSKPTLGFPTKKEWLLEAAEKAVHPSYYEDEERGIAYYTNVDGNKVPVYATSQEQADTIMKAMESADFTPRSDKEKMVLRIISEEAESYYSGDKSIEEVVRLIQSRVNILLQER